MAKSPSSIAKNVEQQVLQILRPLDINFQSAKVRAGISILKQTLADIRIYSNAYELSETRDEQLQNAGHAKKYLAQVQQLILNLSEHNIFGPVDVAHLSAQIEEITDTLK